MADPAALQGQIDALQAQITALKAPVWAKYRAMEMAGYDERIGMSAVRVKLWVWQNHASEVMLWTAVFVVLGGLALSAAQILHAMRLDQKEDGSLDLSVTGLKITSSVTGLLILGMSLGFIYIFAKDIYTIHDPSSREAAQPVAAFPSEKATP